MRAFTFALQKRGHTPEEYEDAHDVDPLSGRFAIADGASESAFAKEWAQILVESNKDFDQVWQQSFPALQEQWLRHTHQHPLPWYLERKVQEGAYSTFLNLVLDSADWRSFAVGDSCLFHVRNLQMIASFPLGHSAEFGVHPELIGSRPLASECPPEIGLRRVGKCEIGDLFFLATDALAEWTIRQCEDEVSPWPLLSSFTTRSQSEFEQLIERIREERAIRNDDVTLVIVEV